MIDDAPVAGAPRSPAGGDAPRFAREWNAALLLVVIVAGLLLATGHVMAGAAAILLGLAAPIARYWTMRRQGRRFYGQDLRPR